jgi:anionic cell wall polymer biosynthesis LytR-Cps2A-Psr (LCP) family protein
VVVARYDLMAQGILSDPCVFIGDQTSEQQAECDQSVAGSSSPGTGPSDVPDGSPSVTVTPPPIQGSALPDQSIAPWDGTDRLNILLVGVDQRPAEGTYNTDTLIVVSIDPVSKQVAMFSLPRDSSDLPLPPGPLANAFGPTYGAKINSLYTAVKNRPDLVPGSTSTLRGMNGLKEVLGNLYSLNIRYFVKVNFQGFEKVVDDLGGVQALVYARSRHGSDDFDRGARQQRVLTSLREQADVATLIPQIPQLLGDVKSLVSTDIPQSQLARLAGLAGSVDTKNVRQYVFAYPRYGSQTPPSAPVYKYLPDVNKIRNAVANAFKVDPNLENIRNSLSDENGQIWVLNGSGIDRQATNIAAYLD